MNCLCDGNISNVLLKKTLFYSKCTSRNGYMKHDESECEACWKTLGLAVSTVPDSGAPGPDECGSEAAFGIAACDYVPPEIQTALLQLRQRLKDPCFWMSSY